MLLGICSDRLMDNLHAVSSAGSGSSCDFSARTDSALKLYDVFLKKKLIASGGITTDICSIRTPI